MITGDLYSRTKYRCLLQVIQSTGGYPFFFCYICGPYVFTYLLLLKRMVYDMCCSPLSPLGGRLGHLVFTFKKHSGCTLISIQ